MAAIDGDRFGGWCKRERASHISIYGIYSLFVENAITGRNSVRSVSVAVHRGSLDIHFDRRSQNFAAEEDVALVDRQGLKIKLDGFFNIRDGLFRRRSLRVAAA
jgi:hypothetical protein